MPKTTTIVKEEPKTEATQEGKSKVDTFDYNSKIDNITFRKISPNTLKVLIQSHSLPEYKRYSDQKEIDYFKDALSKGKVVPPLLISVRLNSENGTTYYTIVDGLKRAQAAADLNYPLLGCFIPFSSIEEEKEHFTYYQNGEKLDSNHLIVINPSEEENKEILRINELDQHPLKGRIYLGQGPKERNQIPAKKLKSILKKSKLDIEEYEDFTRLIGIYEISPRAIFLRPTALNGLASAYRKLLIEGFDLQNKSHMEILSKFDWKEVDKASSKANKDNISEICTQIVNYWIKNKV